MSNTTGYCQTNTNAKTTGFPTGQAAGYVDSSLGQGLTGGLKDLSNIPNAQNDVCPCCGYCKHCGRRNQDLQPSYPYQPYQPYIIYSNPQTSTTTWAGSTWNLG